MSTANKLTYLNTTKQKLKQAINNIGGEVTDETTFREYVNQLENAYDRLPKTEFEEGESVTLENTLKGKLDFDDGKVGFGQASQESTQGYQLIDVSTSEIKSQSNITASKDGNVISMNGTANALGILADVSNFILPESGNTYTFKVIVEGGEWTAGQIGFRLLSSGGTQLYASQANYSQKYIVQQASYSGTPTKFQIYFTSTSVFNNARIRLLLTLGDDTTKSFEQYTGGQASPNPSYPQEIKYVRGKNLFNKATVTQRSYIDAQGVLKGADGTYCASDYIEVYQGSIVWSATTGNGYSLSIYDSSKTFIRSVGRTGNNAMVIPIANGEKYIRFTLLTADLDITQIEQGTQATPYLPYNTIEEVVSGKNKADWENISYVSQNGATISRNGAEYTVTCPPSGQFGFAFFSQDNLKLKPNTNYVFRAKIKSTTSSSGSTIRVNPFMNTTGQGIYNTTKQAGDVASISFTTPSEIPSDAGLALYPYQANAVATYTDIMICESTDINTDYEPYQTPKAYQFSLGDHKFYGIGTYRDYILRTTGKNKFNLGTGTYTKYGFTGTYDGSKMKVNGTTTGSTNVFEPNAKSIGVFKAGSYVLSSFYTGSVNLNGHAHEMCLRSSNDLASNDNILTKFSPSVVNSSKAFTLSQDTELFMQWYANSSGIAYDNLEVMIQIEEGSTATDYEPYGVGVWYKYGKINDYKITGNEAISVNTDLTNTTRIAMYTALSDKPSVDVSVKLPLSNYFVGVQNWSGDVVGIYTNSGSIVFRVPKTIATTEQEIKTWLSSHNVIVCYVLATPTYTPITGTLAEQLEAWWNGQTLNGTTIITSNGNLPMIIKVRGLKGE